MPKICNDEPEIQEYEYIYFQEDELYQGRKTKIWFCRNNRTHAYLGEVKWYGAWRQYCYFSHGGSVYNWSCLQDIQHFLKQQNKRREKERKKS